MLSNMSVEHLGHMPRCRISREIDSVLLLVLQDYPGKHAKHFSSVLAGAIKVSNLVLREFERGGHDEATFRFLTLWHSGHFTGSNQRSAR
jgi:hypothetical protein